MARNSFRNRARLYEAIALSDTGDTRSFNDIYGDEGLSFGDEDTSIEETSTDVKELSPEEIAQVRSLAKQILEILGPDPEEEAEVDTEALAGDEVMDDEDEE